MPTHAGCEREKGKDRKGKKVETRRGKEALVAARGFTSVGGCPYHKNKRRVMRLEQ